MPTPAFSRHVLAGLRDSLNRADSPLFRHAAITIVPEMGPLFGVLRGETTPVFTPEQTRHILSARYLFSQLTDDDGVAIATHLPRIASLGLWSAGVTARGMDALATLPLTELDLRDAKLKRAAFPSLAKFTGLRRLRLGDPKFGDDEVRHLLGLTRIEALEIGGTAITDVGMGPLAALTSVTCLQVPEAVTEVGLAAVAGLPLTRVWLPARTNDAGVQALAAPGRLEEVRLYTGKVTDACAPALAGCPRMRILLLGRCTRITDAALPHLARCTALEELNLAGTKVTGAGLEALTPLKNLHTLHLQHQKLTDKHVPTLAKFTGLKLLMVNMNKLTDEGLAGLKRALPLCDVNTLG